jgi:hypothetical protein
VVVLLHILRTSYCVQNSRTMSRISQVVDAQESGKTRKQIRDLPIPLHLIARLIRLTLTSFPYKTPQKDSGCIP